MTSPNEERAINLRMLTEMFGSEEEALERYDEMVAIMEKEKAEWLATQYERDRRETYPDVREQLDMLWHAIDDGDWTAAKAKTTDFYTKLKKVKDDNPKG